MKKLCLLHLFLTLFFCTYARNALEFFAKHKKVQNFTMEIIKSPENSNKSYWIEYKYLFDLETKPAQEQLKVGFLNGSRQQFDCQQQLRENQIIQMGYSWDVVDAIRETLNISIDITILNANNLTNSDLFEQLYSNLDIIVCHPFVRDRPFEIAELYPTLTSNLLLIHNPSKLRTTKDIFILTFAGWLWTTFFFTLIILALCLRISTMKYAMLNPRKYEPWSWVEITLWAIAAACQQGLSHTPSGFASCLIFFLGYLLAYLLYTGFAAAITSILVQQDINTDSNFDRIDSNQLTLVALESTKYFIQSYKRQFFETVYVKNLDELFDHLNKKNHIGVAPSIYIDQYMAKKFTYEQAASFLTTKLDSKFVRGFLIARNNTWRKSLNKAVLKMDQLGILQNMLERNLRPSQMPDLNTGYSSAGQEHVGSAILLFLGGVAIALFFLFAEIVWYFYKKGRKNLGL